MPPGAPLQTGASQTDPSAGLASQLQGLFWQPLPESDDYHQAPRGAGLLQIPGNVFHNAGDWGQGFATMGSMIGARMLETASGQAPVRSTDFDSAMNFAKAIINDYNQGYFQPAMRGDIGAIYNRAATRPLDVASDALLLAPGVKSLGKATGASHIAAQAAESAMGVGKKLFGAVERTVAKGDDLPGAAARWIKEKQYSAGIINKSQNAALRQFQIDEHILDRAARNLTPDELANLRGYIEGWNPEVFRQGEGALTPNARAFLDANRAIEGDSGRRLLEMKNVTRDQLVRERYKPVIKRWLHAQYGISLDIDLSKISDKALAKLVSKVEADLNSKGFKPGYVPRMSDANINRVLQNPGDIPEWVTTHMARRARAVAEGFPLDDAPKTPFEHERSAFETGANFSEDVVRSIKARRLQVLQAHELLTRMMNEVLDVSKEISKLPADEVAKLDASKAWTRFSPRKFFGNLMNSAPATTPFDTATTMQHFFPEEVFIPTPLAKAFQTVDKWKVGSLEKTMQNFANFARRYILGFNLLWPEKQFGQNVFMLGLFQWKGPRDSLVSFASYALMKDPAIQALIPEWIKGESFAAEAGKPAFGGKLGQVHSAIERGVDFTFQRGQFYDRLSRTVAGIYYGLKLSERGDLSGPIKGLVNSGEAINRLEKVFASSELTEQVGQKVIKVLGDYSRLAASQRQTLRSMLLWWMWYEHILKFAMALPAEAPIKTALVNAIAETHTRLREDAEGMPRGLKQAGAVKLTGMANSQDIPLYTLGGSLNPLGTITELIEFVQQPIEGAESSTLMGAMNPVFTLASALVFGINPQTGRGFRDPRLVSVGGRQYDYDDIEQGLLIEKEPRPIMAGGLEYAMRTFFPQPTRLAERLFAKASTGGEPSQFTSFLSAEGAPRVVYDSGGEPLAAGSYLDILKEALLGQRAFPIDEEATLQNEGMDDYRIKKIERAAERQIQMD